MRMRGYCMSLRRSPLLYLLTRGVLKLVYVIWYMYFRKPWRNVSTWVIVSRQCEPMVRYGPSCRDRDGCRVIAVTTADTSLQGAPGRWPIATPRTTSGATLHAVCGVKIGLVMDGYAEAVLRRTDGRVRSSAICCRVSPRDTYYRTATSMRD
jgi:hypothetical protein